MMANKKYSFSEADAMVAASASFTVALLLARMAFTGTMTYAFYPWNIFLALIPMYCSRRMHRCHRLNLKAVLLLGAWLLFLPNAPYLMTDIFHFRERPGCPPWFDLILVISGAWAGILAGMVSLTETASFLKKYLSTRHVQQIICVVIILCGYGVYMGRFMRFNSWDIITRPGDVSAFIWRSLAAPYRHLTVWAFTASFSVLTGIIFFSVKKFSNGIREPGSIKS